MIHLSISIPFPVVFSTYQCAPGYNNCQHLFFSSEASLKLAFVTDSLRDAIFQDNLKSNKDRHMVNLT